ncbi:hypothetical protein [Bradyrhizobium canariense]|uniref:DUF4747 domain-containing protein n=1 Tax=Bradyrhizobium canariense TaxID=255045 RepID=A0A1H1NR77_9BRAD|nr:hypothetical protein [Bradyrhizobium canariense]SDS01491.1 hypothetical protein SAMN05444158_0729 [Bradyrhizobium canariense]
MHYKLYRYTLTKIVGEKEREIHPDHHFKLFQRSRGTDAYGELAEYRGKRDSVLMFVREYRSDFVGLIGRHSTEREVTSYDANEDETYQIEVDDDDYPNAAFVCLPRLRMIACSDSNQVRADSAMSRLHQILVHRHRAFFVVEPIKETFDLRKAINRFRLIEVTFDIFPVNPHTGDLGLKLDESRKLDHIKKISGKATAPSSEPMTLEGGFLTSVQQLQQSGHAKVGFVGRTDEGTEVKVPKPGRTTELAVDEEDSVRDESVGVRINVPEKLAYPFNQAYVTRIRKIARQFESSGVDDEDG